MICNNSINISTVDDVEGLHFYYVEEVILVLYSIMSESIGSNIVFHVEVSLQVLAAYFQLHSSRPTILWLPTEIDFSPEQLHELLQGVVMRAKDKDLLVFARWTIT